MSWQQIEGGFWGLLVGDAAGVPYEFHEPSEIPPISEIDMFPPRAFARSFHHVPLATWSDDGAQALCFAASLLAHPSFDQQDFARRLLAWSSEGYMAVDGKVFDIGVQTAAALARLSGGEPPGSSGLSGERNNGNGSLMRVLPLALLHESSDLVRIAHAQSAVTHAHPRSQACCALYCLWARREMGGDSDAWTHAVGDLRAIYPVGSAHRNELEDVILPFDRPDGSGYVVNSLHSARLACEQSDYRSVIQAAISLGHDTDTTACIAGGIAGIRHGKAGIPVPWLEALRGTELLHPMLESISRRSR